MNDLFYTVLELIICGAVVGCWILVPLGWTDIVSLAIGILGIAVIERIRT